MIVLVGGFSNSDVFGSTKGWAGSLLYNEKAKAARHRFYARPDTLSLSFCNGCQQMIELGLITPDDEQKPHMEHNDSKKFESAIVNAAIGEVCTNEKCLLFLTIYKHFTFKQHLKIQIKKRIISSNIKFLF